MDLFKGKEKEEVYLVKLREEGYKSRTSNHDISIE